MNLLEQQAFNRRRTWLVMGTFMAFLFLLGAGVDLFLIGSGSGDAFFPIATPLALLVGGGQSYWSLRFGDKAVLKSSAAVPVDTRIAEATNEADKLRYIQFNNIVEEMAIAAGLPKPAAYIIPDDDPNAFATGRDPQHASIAVTEGILRKLNREELQGVVAHEMGHVRNLDIRLMTVVAALVGAVVLLADMAGRTMRFGGMRGRSPARKGKNGGALVIVLLVVWVIAIIVAPVVSRLLAASVSRKREYLADATGAELTRNPHGLASALEKIEGEVGPTGSIKRGTAHLCIADPLGLAIDQKEGRWADLWATHPPMAKRIQALRAMGYGAGARVER